MRFRFPRSSFPGCDLDRLGRDQNGVLDSFEWHVQPLSTNDFISYLLNSCTLHRFVERKADSLNLESFVRGLFSEKSALRLHFQRARLTRHGSNTHHDARWEETTKNYMFELILHAEKGYN